MSLVSSEPAQKGVNKLEMGQRAESKNLKRWAQGAREDGLVNREGNCFYFSARPGINISKGFQKVFFL